MDNILVTINKIGDDDLIDYFNLSTLLGEIVDFVENIFSTYSPNNNIVIDVSSLAIRMRAIEVKLN